MNETRYPLCWPEGWKRCSTRTSARFGRDESYSNSGGTTWKRRKELTIADGVDRVYAELARMGVGDWNVIVSTNVEPTLRGTPRSTNEKIKDPGVAVYWRDRKERKKCMAVDRYDRVADNLAAIAATLDAMRAIERHGGAEILERTFLGFAQLPERSGKNWRDVLGFSEDANPTLDEINDKFRELAKTLHPDTSGGDHERMVQLTTAKADAKLELSV